MVCLGQDLFGVVTPPPLRIHWQARRCTGERDEHLERQYFWRVPSYGVPQSARVTRCRGVAQHTVYQRQQLTRTVFPAA